MITPIVTAFNYAFFEYLHYSAGILDRRRLVSANPLRPRNFMRALDEAYDFSLR